MKNKWECHLCAKEFSLKKMISGFLGNFHPICKKCADKCISENNIHKKRLTFHYKYGEIKMCEGVPVESNLYNQN
ncbi:hypothetical protein [Mariniflexile sp.]|uniref:hypothetical protein n=1 Tax=Mariniflexile sp. TaxID=1979402 RepID=UPI004048247A